jgi:TetR/AcrR family transcriptional regulator
LCIGCLDREAKVGRQKRELGSDARIRENLLKSAVQLFNRKGYAATTVREIVTAVGVSKPVLYYYFGSKEGIFFELMRDPFRKFDAVLGECQQNGGNASERLFDLFRRTHALFLKHIEVVRIMYSLYYGPPQGAPFFDFKAYHVRFWKTVHGLIEEGYEHGEFRRVDLHDATWAAIGPLTVATEAGLSHHESVISADGLSRVLKIILDGIRVVPEKGETC